METANPILGNPLLLAAILLFLAILPRALRQKEKTALDRALERFEKEELDSAAEGESGENETKNEKLVPPKDGSLAYLREDLPTSLETHEENGSIPFPAPVEDREKQVKIVKEGVPISHNRAENPPPAPRKKVKLIKQEISISPVKNKVSSKKASLEPLKEKTNQAPAKDQESKWDEESEGNWVEAEIPGLIIEPPPPAEVSESTPTFESSSKAKHQLEAKKPQKSIQNEKQGRKVKKIAPKSEEKKNSKIPTKQVQIKPDSLQLEKEISESIPKAVEIKAPVVSHKNIAKKGAGKKKAKALSSKAGETQKTEAEATPVLPQRKDIKTSPEKAKPKPFLLNLKYLDQEESETIDPVSHDKLPADMVDVVIARLNALQVNLENQLVSIPDELIPRENPINGNIRTDRIQDSLPDLEETINESSDKREVSLEELSSFLFTATQRKNRE